MQQIWKLLTLINHPIRNGILAVASAVMLVSCGGGGGGGVPPWIGTKQLGVAGKETRGSSVTTDASSNVYVAGYTQGGLDGNTRIGTIDFFFYQIQQQWRQAVHPANGGCWTRYCRRIRSD